MLGRGSYRNKDKVLPGVFVKRDSRMGVKKEEPIKIYGVEDNGDVTLKLTEPFVVLSSDDGEGNVTVSSTYGFSLLTSDDGEGNVSMEVRSK
mgnify:CR=1 FL=1